MPVMARKPRTLDRCILYRYWVLNKGFDACEIAFGCLFENYMSMLTGIAQFIVLSPGHRHLQRLRGGPKKTLTKILVNIRLLPTYR